MKNFKYRILIGVIVFTFIYLLGCFSEASLNILKWNKVTREMVATLGGVLSFGFTTHPFYKFKQK